MRSSRLLLFLLLASCDSVSKARYLKDVRTYYEAGWERAEQNCENKNSWWKKEDLLEVEKREVK